MSESETLPERLRLTADACDREAKSLDVENPEPDEWCPAAGGDGCAIHCYVAPRICRRTRAGDRRGGAAVSATQRGVVTLREVAGYSRVARTVEGMANGGPSPRRDGVRG